MRFGSSETNDFNEDLRLLLSCLKSAPQKYANHASDLAQKIRNYVEDQFLPKLKSLDILIVLSAFWLRNMPMIDLFTITDSTGRRMKKGEEFMKLVSGSFMAIFYKVIMTNTDN